MTNAVQTYVRYRLYSQAGDLLYIGQTRRTAIARWAEHLRDQPWAHEIATMQQDPTVYGSLAEVLAAERTAILVERPRYNAVHNGRNPRRVVVQRGPSRVPVAVRPAVRVWRPWPRWAKRAAFVGGAWLVVFVVLFATTVTRVGVGRAAEVAVTVPTILLVAAWRSRPRRRRGRRR